MHIAVKILATTVTTALIAVGGATTWHLHQKMPVRDGTVHMRTSAPVTVTYDDRGVPHIQAQNEADLYRTLGYVHARSAVPDGNGASPGNGSRLNCSVPNL